MSDEFVENLKQPSAWLRVLFMAGFVLALYVTGVILLVLMLAQILFSLITGTDNTNLRRLGSSLTLYVSQILGFLTYNSDNKPFPFAPFPLAVDDEVADVAAADPGVAEPRPTPQSAQSAANTSPEAGPETAAESAARVMAESAMRRATKSTSKTPKASAGNSPANDSPVSDSATNKTITGVQPEADKATDTGPEMGITDVVDRQAKDV